VKVLLNSGRTFATGDPASGSQSTINGVRVSPIRMHRLTAAQVLLNWTGEDAGSMGVKSLKLIRIPDCPSEMAAIAWNSAECTGTSLTMS
jgi:hypothetical protein